MSAAATVMTMNALPRCSFLLAVLTLLACGEAHGACPIEIPHFRVGADPTYCTHDSIQAAIDSVAGSCPVIIDITREHLYGGGYCNAAQPSGCHLSISGKNVTLQAYGDGVSCYNLNQCIPYPCGAPADTSPLVTLDGGNNGRVLSITGQSNVNVRNLTITHGAVSASASGGGIDFSGAGNLNITRSTIATNGAGYGGGISVSAPGGSLALRLQANTLIQNNTAQDSGGGIRVEGNARLFALSDSTLITFNHALGGYGGGIEILGPARADIGSPGYNGAGVVSNNDAVYGAGVAVVDNGNGEGVLRTFAYDAAHPTAIENNAGATSGGGIYLSEKADACLIASRIADNSAEDGAAVYYTRLVDVDHAAGGSGLYVNSGWPTATLGAECGPESVAALGGTSECQPYDMQCSTFTGNVTKHADGSPSAGATIYDTGGDFKGARFRVVDNIAAQALRAQAFAQIDLSRCLFGGNLASAYLFDVFAYPITLRGCTFANNSIGNDSVLELTQSWSANLSYAIVAQPGKTTLHWVDPGGGALHVSYLLTNSKTGLPGDNPSIVLGTPLFVDAAHGDYHLQPVAQTALDFGADNVGVDLDGGFAMINLPTIPDLFGSSDLGAYERQNLFHNCGDFESVFCDGFGP